MSPIIRAATRADLPAIVRLFASQDGNERDQGQDREALAALDPAYAAALTRSPATRTTCSWSPSSAETSSGSSSSR